MTISTNSYDRPLNAWRCVPGIQLARHREISREPSVTEMLADPSVRALMAADKVDAGELRLLLENIAEILTRRRRFEALVQPIMSVSRQTQERAKRRRRINAAPAKSTRDRSETYHDDLQKPLSSTPVVTGTADFAGVASR
jgi:hypothetical protein